MRFHLLGVAVATLSLAAAVLPGAAAATTAPAAIQASVVLSATQAPTGGSVVATLALTNDLNPATSFTVNFGDGTVVQSTTTTVRHAYATTGTFHATATVTDSAGVTSPTSPAATIVVVPPAPEVIHSAVSSLGGQGASVDMLPSTDSWNITEFTVDWGDGTVATMRQPQPVHNYTTLGTYTITSTIVDAGDNRATTTSTFTTAGARFLGLPPTRLLDTRTGTGTGGVVGKVPFDHTLTLKVDGVGGIPAAAKAVAMNVTVTGSATGGDVSVYPDGVAKPISSTVNFTAGQTVPNLTVVPVGADGSVDLTVVGGPLDLVADVTGYFVQDSTADGYTSLPSQRLLDTRSGVGPVAPDTMLPLAVSGAGGVPPTGASAVALNVTVTAPTQGGFVTAYPGGTARPITSNVNFTKGETVANLVIVPIGSDGAVDLFNSSPGTTQLVADVVGYFRFQGGNTYVPMTPFRDFDTRSTTPIQPRTVRTEPISSLNAPAGVIMNVTVTGTRQSGFVLAAPSPLPAGFNLNAASTLNWTGAGQTLANLAIPATTVAAVSIYNGSDGTTQVIGDVVGYFDGDTPQS